MRSAVERGGRIGVYVSIVPLFGAFLLYLLDRPPLLADETMRIMLMALLVGSLVVESVFFVLVIAQGGRMLNLEQPSTVLGILALLLVAEPALLGAVLALLANSIVGTIVAAGSPACWVLTTMLAELLPDDAV